MLHPVDAAVAIRTELAPPDSFLYKLLKGETSVGIARTEDGSLKTSSTRRELKALKRYLETGQVKGSVERLLEVADFYGVYSMKVTYPSEFARIKMTEDWFRASFNSPHVSANVRSVTYNLTQLTPAHLDSWTLIHQIHWMYARKLRRRLTNFDVTNLLGHKSAPIDYSHPATLEELDQHLYLIHTYPRPDVRHHNSQDLLASIQSANATFKERDAKFDSGLIRESLRRQRPHSHVIYDQYSPLPLNWRQSLAFILSTLNKSPICRLLTSNPALWKNMILAGGSVTNAILGCDINSDYDFFIYGLTEDEATEKVKAILALTFPGIYHGSISRSENVISYSYTQDYGPRCEVQFILRLYTSISEILHGFDVDSACVGFDGTQILMTERAQHAFGNMVNVVDFDRMSPSYEHRLHKYMARGFSVYVPGFDWGTVDMKVMNKYLKQLGQYEFAKRDLARAKRNLDQYTEQRAQSEVDRLKAGLPVPVGIEILINGYFNAFRQTSKSLDYAAFGTRVETGTEGLTYQIDKSDRIISYAIECLSYRAQPDFASIITRIFDMTLLMPNFHHPISIPKTVTWKTSNPGEQVSSTFHKTVLNDLSEWYKSRWVSAGGSPLSRLQDPSSVARSAPSLLSAQP